MYMDSMLFSLCLRIYTFQYPFYGTREKLLNTVFWLEFWMNVRRSVVWQLRISPLIRPSILCRLLLQLLLVQNTINKTFKLYIFTVILSQAWGVMDILLCGEEGHLNIYHVHIMQIPYCVSDNLNLYALDQILEPSR